MRRSGGYSSRQARVRAAPEEADVLHESDPPIRRRRHVHRDHRQVAALTGQVHGQVGQQTAVHQIPPEVVDRTQEPRHRRRRAKRGQQRAFVQDDEFPRLHVHAGHDQRDLQVLEALGNVRRDHAFQPLGTEEPAPVAEAETLQHAAPAQESLDVVGAEAGRHQRAEDASERAAEDRAGPERPPVERLEEAAVGESARAAAAQDQGDGSPIVVGVQGFPSVPQGGAGEGITREEAGRSASRPS
jgi:hypothetical protein